MGFDDTRDRERHDGRSRRYWHPVGPASVSPKAAYIFQSQFWDTTSDWSHESDEPPPYLDAHIRSVRIAPALLDAFEHVFVKYAHRQKTKEEYAEYKRRETAWDQFSEAMRRLHGPKHGGEWSPYDARGSACTQCVAASFVYEGLTRRMSEAFNVSMTEVKLEAGSLRSWSAWVPAGASVTLSVTNKTDRAHVFQAEYDVEVIG